LPLRVFANTNYNAFGQFGGFPFLPTEQEVLPTYVVRIPPGAAEQALVHNITVLILPFRQEQPPAIAIAAIIIGDIFYEYWMLLI
jgi:hypothetical protein